MKKEDVIQLYVIGRFWRGNLAETMCKPIPKDEAITMLDELKSKQDSLTYYKILKVNMKEYAKLNSI